MASVSQQVKERFHAFGELVTELLKLAALLMFGALISLQLLMELQWTDYLFAALVLLAARPLALAIALIGHELAWREWVAAAWFGPKGFASVVYGLLILKSGAPQGEHLFHLIALVVAASIIAHSSTDVLIARWFEQGESGRQPQAGPDG